MPRPGKSTTAGQRWVYRLEGHRKCWFQAAEVTAVKKQVRYRAAKPRVTAPEENEAERPKRKAVVDARAELLRSAPAEMSQPMWPAPELKVADAASVLATVIAAFVPPAPHRKPRDRSAHVRPPHAAPGRRGDASGGRTGRPASSVAVVAPVTFPFTEAADDGRDWMATWLGVLLMALGLVSVLGSSRTLREVALLRD